MRTYVKDPIAFIRNFPFKKYPHSMSPGITNGLASSLIIDIVPYRTDLMYGLDNQITSVKLSEQHHFGREIIAGYLERNYNELGVLPYGELLKGEPINDYTYRISITVLGVVDLKALQWRLQTELDYTGSVLADINTGCTLIP